MGGPEFAVVVAIVVPFLAVFWVVRFVAGVKSNQESLRTRVEALERAAQRQPQV